MGNVARTTDQHVEIWLQRIQQGILAADNLDRRLVLNLAGYLTHGLAENLVRR
ncbi:hypothetical protein A2U01_0103525, partial [Trifolium medium]|nr:hypothetical protein [Trifolium medium]